MAAESLAGSAALICVDHVAQRRGVVQVDRQRRAVGEVDVEVDDALGVDLHAVAVVERGELRARVQAEDVAAGGLRWRRR